MSGSEKTRLEEKLTQHGVRITQQRRVLLEVIENASGHLHASDLLQLAREKDKGIDRATVYRTLSLLKSHHLIDELDLLHLDGSEHHYEVCQGLGHVHIGCSECGRILEYETGLVAQLDDEIRQKTGCEVKNIRIEVSAICTECRK